MQNADNWREVVTRGWAALAATPSTGPGVQTLSLPAGPVGATRLHIADDGFRHLLVRSTRPDEAPGPSGDALKVEVRTLTFDGVDEDFIDVGCTRNDLFDVFDDLVVSIVAETARTGDAAEATITMLSRWRELLRARTERLTHQQEMGVFAELAVLERLQRPETPFRAAWWRGPLREPKDVVVDGTGWAEVKAVGRASTQVTINGLDQLDDLDNLPGFLAVLVLTESDNGASVADLAARLRAGTPPEDHGLFDDLLLRAGWTDPGDARRWDIDEWIVVPATSCPRLRSAVFVGGVPAAVTEVRYDLDIAVLRSQSCRTPLADLRTLTNPT
jgi:hypothetical protein